MKWRFVTLLLISVSVPFCSAFEWQLPDWLSPPPVPKDNPMSSEKVALGQRLFFDSNLSGVGYVSCSTCHLPSNGFAENRTVAVGLNGEFHRRNTQAIVNSAYMTSLTWSNPNQILFEEQAKVPLFGHSPVEMGTKNHEQRVLLYYQHHPLIPNMFEAAFGTPDITFDRILKALGAFQRTLISYNSPFDRFQYEHQNNAISDEAKRGMALFFSDDLGCSNCHSGVHFSDATNQPGFHNTGLYNVDGAGAYPDTDQGLYDITKNPLDMGKFRTPTLRNIALSAPYMHDGSISTLEEVIDHYAAGGRAAMHGDPSPLRDVNIKPFSLSQHDKQALISFLNSLTDESFVNAEQHTSPFR
ncbi:di-heme enzyme [Marinomonas piezotolerans]|uniref:Di-heme enzyme n=1 Tax=Marinomonas piezotolerans TaxID=2213058 RepID=A0A370UE12_9GAMM|nr:methanobactin export MATE transporter MbnM [Marinomonas piezotolerans]RDL45991.1 di-heme enzyme [Marinomonas piezotolerans]